MSSTAKELVSMSMLYAVGVEKNKIVIQVILPNRNHPTWHLVGFVIFQKNDKGFDIYISLWRTTWPLGILKVLWYYYI